MDSLVALALLVLCAFAIGRTTLTMRAASASHVRKTQEAMDARNKVCDEILLLLE